MATSLLTKFQNRRKTSHLGHMYRSARYRAGQQQTSWKKADTHLGGLRDKYKTAKGYAETTQQAIGDWQTQFQESDVGKGMEDVMSLSLIHI